MSLDRFALPRNTVVRVAGVTLTGAALVLGGGAAWGFQSATSPAPTASVAGKKPVPPHQEEVDGCDHGATGKECRPDPQKDHGKDCQQHGNHGGVNEDHCGGGGSNDNPGGGGGTNPGGGGGGSNPGGGGGTNPGGGGGSNGTPSKPTDHTKPRPVVRHHTTRVVQRTAAVTHVRRAEKASTLVMVHASPARKHVVTANRLPYTGTDSAPFGLAGAALVSGGAGLLLLSRRRTAVD